MARLPLIALLCLPVAAFAADDFRVIQLEQELRFLQQQLQQQSQEIAQLRMQLATRPPASPPAATPPPVVLAPAAPRAAPTALANVSAPWLDASRWQRVRAGMSELEVITLLGPPTSMREEQGARLLLYAMEIGASGFLSGRVALRERAVTEVQLPTLK